MQHIFLELYSFAGLCSGACGYEVCKQMRPHCPLAHSLVRKNTASFALGGFGLRESPIRVLLLPIQVLFPNYIVCS